MKKKNQSNMKRQVDRMDRICKLSPMERKVLTEYYEWLDAHPDTLQDEYQRSICRLNVIKMATEKGLSQEWVNHQLRRIG